MERCRRPKLTEVGACWSRKTRTTAEETILTAGEERISKRVRLLTLGQPTYNPRINSETGIALGYGMVYRGSESWQGLGTSLFTTASRPVLDPTQPPIQWVLWALSLGVKRPAREADHSPQSSAEVTNAWSYTSTPQYASIAWCSVKSQGQLYLYLSPFILQMSSHIPVSYSLPRFKYLWLVNNMNAALPYIHKYVKQTAWTGDQPIV
jgi:hypothetical protein